MRHYESLPLSFRGDHTLWLWQYDDSGRRKWPSKAYRLSKAYGPWMIYRDTLSFTRDKLLQHFLCAMGTYVCVCVCGRAGSRSVSLICPWNVSLFSHGLNRQVMSHVCLNDSPVIASWVVNPIPAPVIREHKNAANLWERVNPCH